MNDAQPQTNQLAVLPGICYLAAMSSRLPTYSLLRGPVALTHLLLRHYILPGSQLVDATCGNGKDTLLLAELAGTDGHVWAFDIQETALQRTAARLADVGLSQQVTLLHAGHERMQELVPAPVQAVVFNLGWLPGASHTITTAPATTLAALDQSLQLLAPGGLLLITCYPGHAGGDDETAAVLDWCSSLSPRTYFVWRMGQLNVAEGAPFCLLVQDSRGTHVP